MTTPADYLSLQNRMLRSQHVADRASACRNLSKLRGFPVSQELIGALSDPELLVRRLACDALDNSSDLRAVEPLIPRVADRSPPVRVAACQALGNLCQALGSIVDIRVVAPLLTAFKDQDFAVRDTALAAFDKARGTFGIKTVVCALGADIGEMVLRNGAVRCDWLKHKRLFYFDSVEIFRATDYDVERFCIQVGNDTDPLSRERYQKMQCVINRGCDLSENTVRILRRTFGELLHAPQEG
ncbi:HEAT repeat domain-containing protein [Planctomycetota bacterium]